MFLSESEYVQVYLLFVYICIAVVDPIINREGVGPINRWLSTGRGLVPLTGDYQQGGGGGGGGGGLAPLTGDYQQGGGWNGCSLTFFTI